MQTATKLMNSKRRVIFQSERGAFFVKKGDKKLYGIKAAFKKTPQGAVKKISVNMANTVPLAIRGMARGAPKGPRPGAMLRRMNTESRKKTYRITSPGGTVYKTKKQADIAAFLRRMTAPSPK
jgi:hypothetical protein